MINLENVRVAYKLNTRPYDNVSRLVKLRQLTKNIPKLTRLYALAQANKDCSEHTPRRLIIFSDASAHLGSKAIGIAWKASLTSRAWQCKHQVVPGYLNTDGAEFCGMIQAFAIAAKICAERKGSEAQYDTVAIYTDSRMAITIFERLLLRVARSALDFERLFVSTMLDTTIRDLTEAKVAIELHWCPGHSGVIGNELADKVCVAARKGKATKGATQTWALALAQGSGPKLDGRKEQGRLWKPAVDVQHQKIKPLPDAIILPTTAGYWTNFTKWITGLMGSTQAGSAETSVKKFR